MAAPSTAVEMVPDGRSRTAPARAMAATAAVTALLLVAGIVGAFTVKGGASGTNVSATGALSDAGSGGQLLPAAAAATAKAGSSSYAMTVNTDVTSDGKATKVDGSVTGAFDYVKRVGTLDGHVSGTGLGTEIPGDIHAIFSGTDVYLSGPAVAKKLPAAKEFVKVPLASMHSGLPGTTSSPTEVMSMLDGVVGPPRLVGSDKVRGEDTKHYTVDVDLGKAAAAAQAKANAAGTAGAPEDKGLSSLFGSGALKLTVPADIWLDDSGQVRRLQVNIDLAKVISSLFGAFTPSTTAGTSGTKADTLPTGTIVMTLELFDFGKSVDVQVPPADKVTDAPAGTGVGTGTFGLNFGSGSGTH